MLAAHPIMAFVATTRPEQARAFYQGVLGLPLVEDTPFALVFQAGGTSLRVQKAGPFQPHPFTALGWQVPDIARAVEELTGRGVSFTRYDVIPQDELGVWTTPDGARVAWFKDPDGNTLSLTQIA
jgi:catechol 2,3-dioxygenase-like lactoylglutathione lyase family enzyme